jgi:hypothetical protein
VLRIGGVERGGLGEGRGGWGVLTLAGAVVVDCVPPPIRRRHHPDPTTVVAVSKHTERKPFEHTFLKVFS